MNLYSILGVEQDASQDEIKAAYRKAAQQYHPDRENGDREMFDSVQRAYETLGDPDARETYDLTGDAGSMDTHRRAREKVETMLAEYLASDQAPRDGNPFERMSDELLRALDTMKGSCDRSARELEQRAEELEDRIEDLKKMENAVPGQVFARSLEMAIERRHVEQEMMQDSAGVARVCERILNKMAGDDEPENEPVAGVLHGQDQDY